MKAVLQLLVLIAAIGLLAGAWIGQQVVFPMVPAFGRLARQLPNSIQKYCILSLLAVSLCGTFYFAYACAKERIKRRTTATTERFQCVDPRFAQNTSDQELS